MTFRSTRVLLPVLLIGTLGLAAQGTVDEFNALLRKGDVAAIAAALDKDPGRVTRPDSLGFPPLIWAALSGQRAVVELLIARGADVNAQSPEGTALHAATFGGHADVVRVLITKGAKVNDDGSAGIPPLVLAARTGQAASAEALLEAGATVDARDSGGNTPLLLAASRGNADLVRVLLARKADRTAVNQFGNTPLDVALREGHPVIVELLEAGGTTARKPPERLVGSYLGQRPPGEKRQLFAPGFVSTERRELNAAFTPDGRTLFFSRDRASRGTRMFMTRLGAAGWLPAVEPPFSGGSDVDMFVTADGSEVYFCSDRPTPAKARPTTRSQGGGAEVREESDIWVSRKQGEGWGPATWLGPEVNSAEGADYYPTLTRSGTLYFSSNRPGGLGQNDIYRVRRVDGRWGTPENLGAPVNTAGREFDPFIAPDESYLIFASERSGGLGYSDLYVSVRSPNGTWGTPINLGPDVNSATPDYTPMLSPDGRYLFLTSGSAGTDDIYWIDASVIQSARSRTR